MKKPMIFKKLLIAGLVAAMALGGSTAAFADGKDRDRHHDGDGERREIHINAQGNVQVGNGTVQIILNFGDIEGADVDWAAKNIASLASKKVFAGYEDGTFRPRTPVKRIEAITAAIRLMGLGDKAQTLMNTPLNFKDADKITREFPWAVGYVAVAVENDLFSENENVVQPEKSASRLWATTLLVKALKLEAEAKAKMNTQLSFKDADEIPAGSVGYVAVAVEKGLISGYENNTFRPNKPVTRAELAALLDRTSDKISDKETIKGTVTTAVYNNTLTVVHDSVTQTVYVDPSAFVYRGGVKVTLADIHVGDEVKVRTYNNLAIFIEIIKPAPAPQLSFKVDGLFNGLTLNAQGELATISVIQAVYGGGTQSTTYNVATSVTITGDQSQLVVNHPVELSGMNNVVNAIKIK